MRLLHVFTFLGCLGFLAVSATGCTREKPQPRSDASDASEPSEPRAEPKADPADVAKLVEGNNQFALDLYARLRTEKGNLFCSPVSMSSALAMTYAGARGKTAEQMAQALHFKLEAARLHPAFAQVLWQLQSSEGKRGGDIHLANGLWGQKNDSFSTDFLNLVKTHYGTGLQEVDFAAGSDAARKTVNGWIAKQTKNQLPEVLKGEDITRETGMVLASAIYFKGAWETRFSKGSTQTLAFYPVPEHFELVPMMNRNGDYRYLAAGPVQLLELPYTDRRLSMVVLLPRKKHGLAELEAALTPDKLEQWLGQAYRQQVIVFLPRFKVTRHVLLNQTLADMGMPLAFNNDADFTGATSKKPFFLLKVLHQASVEVNEEGTEARAATVVSGEKSAAEKPSAPPRPPEFRADHPFLFLIRDNRSGSILFIGRLAEPKE